MNRTDSLSAAGRLLLGAAIVVTALLLLATGWTVPFKFESSSILYKFGLEKTYLRSGKLIGITAAVLLFYQVILASGFTISKRLFSAQKLFFLHRVNGMAISVLVILHPLLIKASENFTPYIFEKKYYPEFLGIGMLVVLLILSFTAIFRNFIKLPYTGWLLLHRLGATMVFFLIPMHVLFVSDSFKTGVPHNTALIIFVLNLLMIARIWLRRLFYQGR